MRQQPWPLIAVPGDCSSLTTPYLLGIPPTVQGSQCVWTTRATHWPSHLYPELVAATKLKRVVVVRHYYISVLCKGLLVHSRALHGSHSAGQQPSESRQYV